MQNFDYNNILYDIKLCLPTAAKGPPNDDRGTVPFAVHYSGTNLLVFVFHTAYYYIYIDFIRAERVKDQCIV